MDLFLWCYVWMHVTRWLSKRHLMDVSGPAAIQSCSLWMSKDEQTISFGVMHSCIQRCVVHCGGLTPHGHVHARMVDDALCSTLYVISR